MLVAFLVLYVGSAYECDPELERAEKMESHPWLTAPRMGHPASRKYAFRPPSRTRMSSPHGYNSSTTRPFTLVTSSLLNSMREFSLH